MKKKIILGTIALFIIGVSSIMIWNYFVESRAASEALALARKQAQEPVQTETTVKVYFGNKKMSSNPSDCATVFPIERVIPNDLIVRRRVIEEFLRGPTEAEALQGYFSGLPTKEEIIAFREKIKTETGQVPYEGDEIKIKSVKILAGTAYIVFSREFQAYGNDPCRLGIIKTALREAMKQFPRVGGVMISLEGKEGESINP